MRIPRAVVPGAASGKSIELTGAAYHYLARVLRRRPGDGLVVLDGRGGVFRARLESLDTDRGVLALQVEEPLPAAAPAAVPLRVALGIPRGDGFELAVRWASELGLAGLLPLVTARGTVRPGGGEAAARKVDRWRRLARESAQQCGRAAPLSIDEPHTVPDLLARSADPASSWIALPGAADLPGSGLLPALRGETGGPAAPGPREVLVMVGPEGGFSPEEAARACERGFRPVGFPTPVLKTPTAVLYLAALSAVAGWPAGGPDGAEARDQEGPPA